MVIKKNDDGFIVSVTALVVAVILGLFITYFSNSISLGITSSANDHTNSQANWAAVSGIEFAIINMINGQNNFAGTYSFFSGTIALDTMTIDPINNLFQVTSTGTYGNSIRIFEITFQPVPNDTLLSEGFDDDEGFEYYPAGAGPGAGRFWGMTCVADHEFIAEEKQDATTLAEFAHARWHQKWKHDNTQQIVHIMMQSSFFS